MSEFEHVLKKLMSRDSGTRSEGLREACEMGGHYQRAAALIAVSDNFMPNQSQALGALFEVVQRRDANLLIALARASDEWVVRVSAIELFEQIPSLRLRKQLLSIIENDPVGTVRRYAYISLMTMPKSEENTAYYLGKLEAEDDLSARFGILVALWETTEDEAFLLAIKEIADHDTVTVGGLGARSYLNYLLPGRTDGARHHPGEPTFPGT